MPSMYSILWTSELDMVIHQIHKKQMQLRKIAPQLLVHGDRFLELNFWIVDLSQLLDAVLDAELIHYFSKMHHQVELMRNRNLSRYMMKHGQNVSPTEMHKLIQFYAELIFIYDYLRRQRQQSLQMLMLNMPLANLQTTNWSQDIYIQKHVTVQLDWYFKLPF